MANTLVDETRFPLVIATAFGTPTLAEYETFLSRLDGLLTRGRHAVVVDASRADALPAALRQRHAAWAAARAVRLASLYAAYAVVTTDPLVRGTITAIHWLHVPPHPFKVVATREEAEAWCKERLGSASFTRRERPADDARRTGS